MDVPINPDLELRLRQAAQHRAQSIPELVEQALTRYLDALDDPTRTVRGTQQLLNRIWPAEDFSDWRPPDAG